MIEKLRHQGLSQGYLPPVLTAATVLEGGLLLILLECYRTEWGQDHLSSLLLSVVAGLLVITAMFCAVSVWRVWRHCQQHRSLDLVLEEIARLDGAADPLRVIGPCPTGSCMPDSAKGWNRLLTAIEQLRESVDLMRAESDLKKTHQIHDSTKLMSLLDAIPDGIIVADASGTVLLANRSCEGKMGKVAADFVGQSILELFDDPQAGAQLKQFLEHKTQGNEISFDVTISQNSSGSGPSPADASPTSQASEEPEKAALPAESLDDSTVLRVFCYSFSDISDLSDMVLIVRDVSQQVLSENRRDEFIAHVSHEFRSPLTNIRAYTETLLSDMVLDAATQKEAFNVINDETSRLIRLVNEVLDLSRLESGSMTLEKNEVVLDRLVRQSVNDVNAMASSKKITVQTNYHPKLPNLYADREKLAVVINNVLTNAIKYTPEGGTVFIETNCDERFVYIKVTDTGIGIAEADTARIFDKFYRVDRPETAKIPGSGLGLASSKEIVTLHGGTIGVSSQLNKGTEMLVKLPLTISGPVLGPAQKQQP